MPLNPVDVISYLHGENVHKELAEALLSEHRTHQQSVVRNLYGLLKLYGENPYDDLRNEAAKAWARKITAEEAFFPYV